MNTSMFDHYSANDNFIDQFIRGSLHDYDNVKTAIRLESNVQYIHFENETWIECFQRSKGGSLDHGNMLNDVNASFRVESF